MAQIASPLPRAWADSAGDFMVHLRGVPHGPGLVLLAPPAPLALCAPILLRFAGKCSQKRLEDEWMDFALLC